MSGHIWHADYLSYSLQCTRVPAVSGRTFDMSGCGDGATRHFPQPFEPDPRLFRRARRHLG
jgi:hypothetical protein